MNIHCLRRAGSLGPAVTTCLAVALGTLVWVGPAQAADSAIDTSQNTLLPAAHTDMAPILGADGELELTLHQDSGNHDPATTVIEVPATAAATVPVATTVANYDFMAPPGSQVWILPELQDPELAWLGWSSQRVSTTDYEPPLFMRFEGVSGLDGGAAPGDLVLSDSDTPSGGTAPLASTREGLPHTLTLPANIHKHLNWTFTAPGTYCLGVSVEGTLADGDLSSETSVLTFVVGSEPGLDATAAPTCEQNGVNTVGVSLVEPDVTGYSSPTVIAPTVRYGSDPGSNAYATLRPALSADGLGVDLIEGSQVDGGTAHDPAATVIAVPARAKTSGYFSLGGAASLKTGSFTLYWDTTRLAGADLDGPLSWRLTNVRAPGQFKLQQYVGGSATWSTLSGEESDSFETLAGRGNYFSNGRFYSAGVYCLGVQLSAGRADGTPISSSTTLRFTVALDHPELATETDCGLSAEEFAAMHPGETQQDTSPLSSTASAVLSGTPDYGSVRTLAVRVVAGEEPATGTVTTRIDGAPVGDTPLSDGGAAIALPATLAAGQHTITVDYPGGVTASGKAVAASGATAPLSVTRAATTLTLRIAKRAKNGRHRGTVRVLILGAASGMTATGTVKVYDGKRKLQTIQLSGTGARSFRLPRLASGKHRIKAVYTGTGDLLPSKRLSRLRS